MIMAEYPIEKTTDVPEHSFLKVSYHMHLQSQFYAAYIMQFQDDPDTDWDERARGLGGTLHIPVSSGAEENVMCYDDGTGFIDKQVSVAEIYQQRISVNL